MYVYILAISRIVLRVSGTTLYKKIYIREIYTVQCKKATGARRNFVALLNFRCEHVDARTKIRKIDFTRVAHSQK
jgi:hypothetical protein